MSGRSVQAPDEVQGLRIHVTGVVQGVGFRPFVYALAQRLALTGWVRNTAGGVEIEVDGSPVALQAFVDGLSREAPPLARIDQIAAEASHAQGFGAFSILASQPDAESFQPIAPDVGICQDCLRELRDPTDRRYRYPFINCTNCGPRFTIITDIPYDRPNTTMRTFDLCPACAAEYGDPSDRRFHAQPVACPTCGPRIWLESRGEQTHAGEAALQAARRLLAGGSIVAIKGLGGFHLAVDALNADAVDRLRQRKLRVDKAFALMLPDLQAIERHCLLGEAERKLLSGWERPIVVCRRRPDSAIAAAAAPGQNTLGVMLPYTPLHHLLIEAEPGFPQALVLTSGNLSEEPIATDNDQARQSLHALADAFLMHDRPIHVRCDDSVVRAFENHEYPLRRSRGFAPYPVHLPWAPPSILGAGPELKNTFCLTRDAYAFLSQHIGDLENLTTYEFFQQTIAHMRRILAVRPELIACDLHPDYLSTRFAREQTELPVIAVQHHHAHIVSAMAEHHIEGPVIGVACDGTGYGPDGTVWGGEVLVAEAGGFERAAHLACVAMPGSAAAIKEPWRMAVSYLEDAYGDAWPDIDLPMLKEAGESKTRIVREMIARRVNSPLTSSLGRLFDGVAALAGIRGKVSYEGQAAMELEMAAADDPSEAYEFAVEGQTPIRILPAPVIRGVVQDLGRRVPLPVISARFHNTVVRMLAEVCARIGRERGLKRVVLSGGVFQNARLLSDLIPALTSRGFEVYSHRLVPTNDGGIALGQAVAAARRMERGVEGT